MTTLPYSTFFWNDWQGDPLLKLCSFAAQGVWMRLLCIAAESKRRGYVLVNGRQPTMDELARILGGATEEVSTCVAELDRNGVSSRDKHGTIYCRRMVRDEKKRLASAKGGKKGGRTTHDKQKGIFTTQGATQDGTQGDTKAPLPLPLPLPSPQKKESVPLAKANGRHEAAALPFEEPSPRRAAKDDPWKEVYDYGKEILGASAGGVITNLRKTFGDRPKKVLGKLEDASRTSKPLEWINAFLWEHGPAGIQVGAIG